MRVCLIDADSKIPNLALMKLSTYHKKKGDSVDLVKADLPYYPNKEKSVYYVPEGYDKYYCSVVFSGNKEYVQSHFLNPVDIEFGGSGVDYKKSLPPEIDACELDYSIYPENKISYGFISRGCIRKCYFCIVPKKEGGMQVVDTIKNIVKHKKVKFLDNNFLALDNHKDYLRELVESKLRCQFIQGLDIRLVDKENAELLGQLNYMGDYIFAFDFWELKKTIYEKLKLMSWRRPYRHKFYVYCDPKRGIDTDVKRVLWLKQNKCLPYIMRDISCWTDENSDFYVDISGYCNQPALFKKMEFEEYLNKRHTNKARIEKTTRLFNEIKDNF